MQLLPIKANKKAINRTRLTAVNGIDPKQKNLKKKNKKVGKNVGVLNAPLPHICCFNVQCCAGGADRLRVGGYGGRDNEASALCRPIQGIVTGSYRLTG